MRSSTCAFLSTSYRTCRKGTHMFLRPAPGFLSVPLPCNSFGHHVQIKTRIWKQVWILFATSPFEDRIHRSGSPVFLSPTKMGRLLGKRHHALLVQLCLSWDPKCLSTSAAAGIKRNVAAKSDAKSAQKRSRLTLVDIPSKNSKTNEPPT